jgi:hypothetical protein
VLIGELTNSEEALRKRREEFREYQTQQNKTALAAKLLRIRSNDDPFLKGYPGEPLVQRIGVFTLGAFFSLGGAVMLDLMLKDDSHLGVVISILALIIGARTIIVAFTGRKAKSSDRA